MGLGVRSSGPRRTLRNALQRALAFELGLVLQAIIARQPADELKTNPVIEDPADVFARDSGHRRHVALADLVADQDASAADVLTKCFRQIEQRPRHASLEREKASGRDDPVGAA